VVLFSSFPVTFCPPGLPNNAQEELSLPWGSLARTAVEAPEAFKRPLYASWLKNRAALGRPRSLELLPALEMIIRPDPGRC